ncbi:S-adenosyl-L-methionine-dependent methyltransferase [Cryomyces antarcticus]
MSLYYEAAAIVINADNIAGSLKSRIFGKKDLKSQPAHLFALVSEATKWSELLKDVIERSGLLRLERKLTPALALLLTHDLLLSKNGVSAPKNHALTLAITKHKARLFAEFTKLRLKRGFATIEALRAHINSAAASNNGHLIDEGTTGFVHPRWIRVNTLKTTLEEQLPTTFADFVHLSSIAAMTSPSSVSTASSKTLCIDKHIPNLVAVHPSVDFSKHPAYLKGEIIFQDKASCFPAYLLHPDAQEGDVIDACAAPGNKTTHLSALLHEQQRKDSETGDPSPRSRVYACERDKKRAETLQKMIKLAGADSSVTVKAGQDFLRLDPANARWANISALLLDPSCSGSGIVGRDDVPTAMLHLPSKDAGPESAIVRTSKKRKRKPALAATPVELHEPANAPEVMEEEEQEPPPSYSDSNNAKLQDRLTDLSAFQLKLLLHAFRFPSATKITYSTCSVHLAENEGVVLRALTSDIARATGWRLLKRTEQVQGMREWGVRGCEDLGLEGGKASEKLRTEISEACIRCEKGTEEGTMGFFVAAFTREGGVSAAVVGTAVHQIGVKEEQEEEKGWNGFSDDGGDEVGGGGEG